jgi:pyruvate,orthophosphate dikinase
MASCADAIVRWQPVIGGVNMKFIEQLGQTDILVPSLIAEGLAANYRVKVRMSALQAPAERAHNIDSTPRLTSRPSVAPPFDSASAEGPAACPTRVILLRPDTSTTDIAGFATAIGGRTAHAALVARQWGSPVS